jgi:hypothetical protein
MTLAEYDQKIIDLKKVQAKASGLKLAEITAVIDDLETARLESITSIISSANFGFSDEDISELRNIAQAFESASNEIDEANELIDNAISLGKKLLALL